MPNPNPKRTNEFKEREFKASSPIPGDGVLSKKPICVKYPVEIDNRLRAMEVGERTSLLRQLVWDWMQNNPVDA